MGKRCGLPAAIRCIRGIVSTHPFAGDAALAKGPGRVVADWNVAAFAAEQGFALLPEYVLSLTKQVQDETGVLRA